ncbi:PPE domain-containing protein [Actinosynnema sp. NPDC023587]|uniref:PPE domain-containing protein n=1 Tax=Actinosynnema sp. NPDC023587 TaxID=3154695 RepID=UPI0033E96220
MSEHRNERRHRFHSDDHPPTRKQREAARKVSDRKKANRRPEKFGKINWDVYSHRELWDMVKSADLGRMGQRTHDWQVLARELGEATEDVQKLVGKLVESWHGPSSAVAAGSVSRLTQWATEASQRAYQVGGGLDGYTHAVDEAARRMPVPVHPDAERWFRDGYDVTTLSGPQGAYLVDQLLDDHLPSKKEQQAAKADAVRVMDAYEQASREEHDRLPLFDDAPAGTKVEPDHRPWTVGPERTDPVRPVPPILPTHPQPQPQPQPHLQPDPEPGPHPGQQADPRPADTTGVAAAGGPAGFGIPGLPGGSAVPGGYAAGSPGGHSGFGPGSGGYGTGFGPVGPGGSSGVIGAVPGGAAARGGVVPVTAGGQGGYGVVPPVAPGNREEDGEHRNRYDTGLDLLDDLPPAFPPVLGE